MPTTNAPAQPTERHYRTWSAVFDEITAWTKATGRLPKRRSANAEEYRLANWLNVQRANYRAGKLHPGYIARLGLLPGALETRKTRTHREWATEIAAFHSEHGRLPSVKAADPQERSLGHYLSERLRAGVASGAVTASDCEPLASVPEVLSPVRRRTTSDQYLEQLRTHVSATAQMPGWKGERPLARWVRRVLTSSPDENIHGYFAEVSALQDRVSGQGRTAGE